MSTYLKENNVKGTDGTDVNSIMRDIMSIILEGALNKEMNVYDTIKLPKKSVRIP